ncbi:hypothetical protein N9811_00590 [Bacteroidia bacterium]|nr:hypothetical protein [Bacteroidia bacterium]
MSPKELLGEADSTCNNTPEGVFLQKRIPTETKIALTDINSTSGCLYHAFECQRRGWPVIMGVDFRKGNGQQFIAIAKDNEGFQNINFYLTEFLLDSGRNTPWRRVPTIKNAFIIYPLKNVPDRPLRSNEYIGVNHTELFNLRVGSCLRGTNLHVNKYLALNPVTFRNKRDYNAHRLLRAIDKNSLLSKLPIEELCETLRKWHDKRSYHVDPRPYTK